MLIIDSEQILRIRIHRPRRPEGTLPFVLVCITDEVMSAIARDDCPNDVQLPFDIEIPSEAEVAFRNLTGYEYAPSTDEHWGVHIGDNRVLILMRDQIL